MIILKMVGGFGNQLQIYALYRKLLRCGADRNIKFEISWYDEEFQKKAFPGEEWPLELRKFHGLPLPVCTEEEKNEFLNNNPFKNMLSRVFPIMKKTFTETKMFHPEVYDLKDKYIEGYFSCQKYYDDVMDELQELLVFPEHPDSVTQQKNIELMEEMEERNSVSLHIRRGDYLRPENYALFSDIVTEKYYCRAMDYFKEKYENVHFYVFSDDPDYALEKYGQDRQYTVITHHKIRDAIFDVQLMSHCKNNICANSTFSFAGARLNRHRDKEVIRPLTMRNNQKCDPMIMHEYWQGWILIDKDGDIR